MKQGIDLYYPYKVLGDGMPLKETNSHNAIEVCQSMDMWSGWNVFDSYDFFLKSWRHFK